MTTSSFARAFAVLGFSALLVGCSGTQWSQVQTAPAYQAPKQIKVAIVVQAKGDESLKDAAQSLKDALTKELTAKGITPTFVPAPDGTPAAELTVAEWDEGSRALRWLGFGGEGHIIVIVKSPSSDGQPGFSGTARGYIKSGWYGGSSLISAEEAGTAIGTAIATGKAE
jgi:hypothetical protein